MYEYKKEKERQFTEAGQAHFLKVRDVAQEALSVWGAFRAQEIEFKCSNLGGWFVYGCLDRLVELGELKRCGTSMVLQHQVFIKN